ncbi:MAG: hypothetical protein DRJ03_25720 [Chloroflexi bacterium]|nr:MAG: hypothetical protein DRI81_14855 [Chloroflexota bacterium]RLC78127.1 MAG: hypothetical protein DRJ03_25720 [Chloroflexota bacterium]
MGKERPRSNSFVLRIWWEEEGWRGWVQHAASGESRYFERLADLLAFVEAQTGSLGHSAEAVGAGKGGGS